MGRTWAKTLREYDQVETVGWMDIRAGAAGEAIEQLQFTGVKPFDDLGKALAETRPDFVVDVTIPEAHRSVTLAALAAGIPVLGEKADGRFDGGGKVGDGRGLGASGQALHGQPKPAI